MNPAASPASSTPPAPGHSWSGLVGRDDRQPRTRADLGAEPEPACAQTANELVEGLGCARPARQGDAREQVPALRHRPAVVVGQRLVEHRTVERVRRAELERGLDGDVAPRRRRGRKREPPDERRRPVRADDELRANTCEPALGGAEAQEAAVGVSLERGQAPAERLLDTGRNERDEPPVERLAVDVDVEALVELLDARCQVECPTANS